MACAAAVATLDVLQEESLVENAARQGELIMRGIRELQQRHPIIGDVRGAGLIVGVELVRDPVSRAPASKECARVVLRCQQLGLLTHYVGIFSNVIEITPPLVLTPAEASRGLEIVEQALCDVEAGRVSDAELEGISGW